MVKVRIEDGFESQPNERRIFQMEPGEVGYTVPWAFDVETEELNENHWIKSRRGGTVTMRVLREDDGSFTIGPKELIDAYHEACSTNDPGRRNELVDLMWRLGND